MCVASSEWLLNMVWCHEVMKQTGSEKVALAKRIVFVFRIRFQSFRIKSQYT
jgi:hypothetical protein